MIPDKILQLIGVQVPGFYIRPYSVVPLIIIRVGHKALIQKFLAHTVQNADASKENLFLEVLRVESLDKIDPVPISEDLRQTVRTARAYFKMKGYSGVPILVVMERPGWEMVLRGEGNITEYLRVRGFLPRELQFPGAPSKKNGNGEKQ